MIAIITKILPATDRRGIRVVATAPDVSSNRVQTAWEYGLPNSNDNHENAAIDYIGAYLSESSGRSGWLLVGSAPLGDGSRVHLYRRTA